MLLQLNRTARWRAWLSALLLTALLVAPGSATQAQTVNARQAPATELPTRPDPIQLPARPKSKPGGIKGGHIELTITPAADIWTEVEWQSGDGNWHVVEGWRGYTSTQGAARWFVQQSELGKGPFRWQIYLYEGGDYLATSDPFMLPGVLGDKVVVTLSVPALAVYLY